MGCILLLVFLYFLLSLELGRSVDWLADRMNGESD
jgi:hypothetical protein